MSTRKLYSHSISIDTSTLSGNTNPAYIEYRTDVPIELWEDETTPHKKWMMCLSNLTCYNTQPNVSPSLKNNLLSYTWGSNPTRNIVLPEGTYSIGQLNAAIQNYMLVNHDYVAPAVAGDPIQYDIVLSPNIPLNSVDIDLAATGTHTSLDLTVGFFCNLLGYNPVVLDSTISAHWTSDNNPNMSAGVSTYNVECNVITGTQRNGQMSSILYTFSPSVEPGSLIRVEPLNQQWLPLRINKSISEMIIRLVSNTGAMLNLRGENVTMTLLLKYAEMQ